MITHFQRFIHRHGRWFFALLLVVVVFAFLLMDYSGAMYRHRESQEQEVHHKLFGRTVPTAEMDTARKLFALSFLLSTGQDITNMLRDSKQLDRLVLERMAMVEKARQLGIRASEEEVLNEIRKLPMFQEEGKFSLQRYNRVVEVYMTPRAITEPQLSELMENTIITQKLMDQVTSTVKIPAGRVYSEAVSNAEKISIAAFRFESSDFLSKVKSTPEDLKAYYQAHQDKFMSPEKIQVSYVEFPIVVKTGEVPEADVKKYYEEHQAEYLEADGKKSKPLKSVEAEIRKELAGEKAQQDAGNAAMQFAQKLLPGISNEIPSLDQVAKESGVNVKQTGFFAESDALKEIASQEFASAAFRLHQESPVSDPIQGDKAYYVAYFKDRQLAAPKTFEVAQEEVKKAYVDEKAMELARETGKKMLDEYSAQMASGKKSSEIAKALKIKPLSIKEFTEYNLSTEQPDLVPIKETAIEVAAGAVSPFISDNSGGYFVHVISRAQPKPEEVREIETAIREKLTSLEKQRVMSDFRNSVMKEADLGDS